jgi:hypothetical protein
VSLSPSNSAPVAERGTTPVDLRDAAWDRTCFYSSPIGNPGSEERRHSDVFLNSLIRPAVEALGPPLRAVRADLLPSGLITASVIEHVFRSRLMIADLSYHNANVLHEVGLRHATGQPCVLVSRTHEQLPANLKELRVVFVDTSEVACFMQEFEARRDEITRNAEWALSSEAGASPIEQLFPDYRNYL